MSNLVSFALASIFSLLSIWAFYFLIKKWPKFHVNLLGKALKTIYALILFFAVTLSLVLAYNFFQAYWEDDRVRVVTEFQGVQLGWSKDELYFRYGEPISIEVKNDNSNNTFLTYENISVLLINDKVVKVVYPCDSDNFDFQKVGGISCGDNVDRVTNQYGQANPILISEDKLWRIYNYPKYNLAFLLSKSNVELMAIFDSKMLNGLHFKTPSELEILPSEDLNALWKSATPTLEAPKPLPIISEPTVKSADAEKYAEWIVKNKDKKGTPEFETVAEAYKQARAEMHEQLDDTSTFVSANENTLDHCALNITKSERLRRLGLKGTVRETGYQTYAVGNYEITFSANDLISCR